MRRMSRSLRIPFALALGALLLVALAPVSRAQSYLIHGTITWEDDHGVSHPLAFARVELLRFRGFPIGSQNLGSTTTGADGTYTYSTPDIEWFEGEAPIFLFARGQNQWMTAYLSDASIVSAESGQVTAVEAAGSVQVDLHIPLNDPSEEVSQGFSMFQAVAWAARAATLLGYDPSAVQIHLWKFQPNYSAIESPPAVLVPFEQAYDWDVIQHLYGHHFMRHLGIGGGLQHDYTEPDPCKDWGLPEDFLSRGWSEGFSRFFAILCQEVAEQDTLGIAGVGNTIYEDSRADGHVFDLDAQSPEGRGENNFIAIARWLWDLYDEDAVPEGRDDRGIPLHVMLGAFQANPDLDLLSDHWKSLMGNVSPGTRQFIANVGADHGIGPELLGPADGAVLDDYPLLEWTRAVGCTPETEGNVFYLEFYDPNTGGALQRITIGNTTSYPLGEPLWDLLQQDITRTVRWAILASHNDGQTFPTGPYRGETFLLTINEAPTARLGGQTSGSCEGLQGTSITLNGSPSFDPDGDPLTFAWTAPGATIGDPTSAFPGILFPVGTTDVELVVSDGIASDTVTTVVTITDDLPPAIECPEPITVDCTEACTASGPLAAWLLEVSAGDNCDPNVIVTNDAPECFGVGTTEVRFTATDGSGNSESCTVDVTVVDDDPPTITATARRDLLWPPNNKMTPIQVDVVLEDDCDPYPQFTLDEILVTENGEPVPGNGDIQGAGYGTDDAAFDLRAKRSGGTERKYWIVYTATDASGNAASDTACVIVPASKAGTAFAAAGFAGDGKSLRPGNSFSLLLPSGHGVRPEDVVGERVFLGNHLGAVTATRTRLVQMDDGDGVKDLEIVFEGSAARDLIAASGKSVTVALQYETGEGTDYLVLDILDLGPPVYGKDDDTAETRPRVADGTGDLAGADVAAAPLGLFSVRLEHPGPVTVEVYDVTGRRVRTVHRGDLGAGTHDLPWDGRFDTGRSAPSGIYFYRLQYPQGVTQRKILVSR